MRLLIIRHGDPDYEHDTLTTAGEREARLLAAELSGLSVAAAYVSPLGRAQDTARPVLEAWGIRANVLPWLREFDAVIRRPDLDQPTIPWDWLPQDWTAVDDFFSADTWLRPAVMAESNTPEKYHTVCEGVDDLLNRHGYRREGRLYRVHAPHTDTVALFCHFGVECVILSHLLNISPMTLWHGFAALTSSVTTVYTEERREGIASFRVCEFGAVSHLRRAGVEPSFSSRFCECWKNQEERHD